MEPSLEIILKKQCKVAGVDFETIDFKEGSWFNDYSWTKEQQDLFQEWFVDFLYNNIEARKEIMRFPKRSKKSIDQTFFWWNLSYGFKLKQDD